MSNLPANISSLVANLETAKASRPVETDSDFTYLKMDKAGIWVYGADETEVSDESFFVIDPASYSQGFVAWDENELIDEKMSIAGQTPITLADLPQLPAGVQWKAQVGFALKGVEGAEEGIQMLYKTSSKGGKNAISGLLDEIIKRAKAGEASLCPVVALETTNYKHKKWGKIYTPVLSVDEWVDLPASDAKDAPVKTPKVAKEAPVAEAEPELEPEEAPKKRRRSRTAA